MSATQTELHEKLEKREDSCTWETHKMEKHERSLLPLVGPRRDPMACCSSDTLSRRTTSARADFSSWISSSCIWTRCSREAMRSVTSMLLAAEALSSGGNMGGSFCLDVNGAAEVETQETSVFGQKLSKEPLKWSKLYFS